jgi:Hydantoinase/oxoprolinase C-terminal domain
MVGKDCVATVYDRARLKAGNRIAGPAIVMEMDSTSVILPRHHGKVDAHGNILIYPDDYQAPRAKAGAAKPKAAPAKVKRTVKKTVRKAK